MTGTFEDSREGASMAVPGRRWPDGAPRQLAETELFSVDAYLRDFDASVELVDREAGRVALRRTAFFPTHVLSTAEVGRVAVTGTESKGKGNKRVRLEVLP
jgi:Ser-tRNA(Ala) deacylase AlaX